MKFECRCGAVIFDITDGVPNKAHLISDQDWYGVLEAIDAAIEKTGPSAKDREAACMRIATLLAKISTPAWQCSACARLYVQDKTHALQEFAPYADGVPNDLFSSRRTPASG